MGNSTSQTISLVTPSNLLANNDNSSNYLPGIGSHLLSSWNPMFLPLCQVLVRKLIKFKRFLNNSHDSCFKKSAEIKLFIIFLIGKPLNIYGHWPGHGDHTPSRHHHTVHHCVRDGLLPVFVWPANAKVPETTK